MHSKNKPAMTVSERSHVSKVAALACVVCDSREGSEVHEPEQGMWFISIALCPACHRGSKGWHGTRDRWKNAKMNELKAIDATVRAVYGGAR